MLTDKAVRAMKSRASAYKRHHRDGLFLIVEPSGRKVWSSRWTSPAGEQSKRHDACYPELGIAGAYRRHRELLDQIAQGLTPAVKRQAKQAGVAPGSYGAVAREYFQTRTDWSERTRGYHERWFAYCSALHRLPVAAITVDDVLPILRKLEADSREVAGRALMQMQRVFRYARLTRRCTTNPVDGLGEVLKKPKESNLAALPRGEVGALLRAVMAYPGSRQVFLGFHLVARTWVRTSEAILAKPEEFDLDGKVWRIPEERMKNRIEHIVPLAPQVVAIVRELMKLNAGNPYILTNANDPEQPMSNNAWLTMLYRLGYAGRMTTHGWRSVASTLANEQGFNPDAVERQLAHLPKDRVRARYLRTTFLEERAAILRWWSDLLDGLEAGTMKAPAPRVTAIHRVAA
jgi:integrase